MTGEGVFLCGRERGGVLTGRERERESEQSDPSCDEDTPEKCIPQAESTRKAAKQTKSIQHHLNLSATTSDCL